MRINIQKESYKGMSFFCVTHRNKRFYDNRICETLFNETQLSNKSPIL